MTLAECPAGAHLRVLGVAVEPAVRLRLREIGVHDGALLRLTRRGPFGGRVVAVGASRVALDAATARLVHVEPLPV